MKSLGLCWLTVPTATPIELVGAAAAGGMSWVGMRILEAGDVDTAFVRGSADTARVRGAASDQGVSILRTAGFRLDGRYSPDRYHPFIEATAELGAKFITLIATDNNKSRLVDDFGDICGRAAQYGLLTSVEFAPFSAVKNLYDAKELLASSGQNEATIVLDALHFFRSGGKIADIATVDPARFSVAQVCDGPLTPPRAPQLLYEARNDRLDPGAGEFPLVEFLKALPTNIPMEIECPCLAQRDLPPNERAKNAARASRDFLDGVLGPEILDQ
jgi:sugar phosphate isomerase/epimerase